MQGFGVLIDDKTALNTAQHIALRAMITVVSFQNLHCTKLLYPLSQSSVSGLDLQLQIGKITATRRDITTRETAGNVTSLPFASVLINRTGIITEHILIIIEHVLYSVVLV